MKIYTRGGDGGMTSIVGGKRLPKHHPRIEAYGTLDELIAWIDLLRGIDQKCVPKNDLVDIQSELMACCAIVASDPEKETETVLDSEGTAKLEKSIDEMEEKLAPLSSFILPGGDQNSAFCNIARCVCRRAERNLLRLNEKEIVPEVILKYLNRLSDYLFVLTRCLSYESGNEEVGWNSKKSRKKS